MLARYEQLKEAGVDLVPWIVHPQRIKELIIRKKEDGSFLIENNFELCFVPYLEALHKHDPRFKRSVKITYALEKINWEWRASDPLISSG